MHVAIPYVWCFGDSVLERNKR